MSEEERVQVNNLVEDLVGKLEDCFKEIQRLRLMLDPADPVAAELKRHAALTPRQVRAELRAMGMIPMGEEAN